MPTVDEQGNKLPQPKIKKKDKSKSERIRAKGKGKHCPDCGFRVRSPGHESGKQHKQSRSLEV